MTAKLTERSEWKALESHYSEIKDTHMRDLFADEGRASAFTLKAELQRGELGQGHGH